MLHTCVFGSVSGEGQVSGVISMADPTTPLLLQNIRVTALLLQNETAEIGDPRLSQLTEQMLGHFKEVVQYITTHGSGAPLAVETSPSSELKDLGLPCQSH
jgi:hypothetical protein